MKPLHIAALVKQIPKFEEMRLGPDGRLQREGVELAMNPYCLRAVSKGVELAEKTGGSCTVISLGPPAAEDVVRWGVAGGATRGVLISDPAFAGSDTLATARALAAAIRKEGPFDVILVGKNSVDADTGQVGPELAELLGYPFISAVRQLDLGDDILRLGCEHDDAWVEAEVSLPAVLATAERLCPPVRAEPEERAAVAAEKLTYLRAADLGAGPWGQAGSPTWVGETRLLEVHRTRQMLQGSLPEQIAQAVSILQARGALATTSQGSNAQVASTVSHPTETIAVLLEPERVGSAQELLGTAAHIATRVAGKVVAIQAAATQYARPAGTLGLGCRPSCDPATRGACGRRGAQYLGVEQHQPSMGHPGTEYFMGTRGSLARGSTAWGWPDRRCHPARRGRAPAGELEAGVWWTTGRRHSGALRHPNGHCPPRRPATLYAPRRQGLSGRSPADNAADTFAHFVAAAKRPA